jgi:hypothetical protein
MRAVRLLERVPAGTCLTEPVPRVSPRVWHGEFGTSCTYLAHAVDGMHAFYSGNVPCSVGY